MTICPGCGSTAVLPGRLYCRPSCKAKHEHRERQQRPSLFSLGDSLQSEWPDEDDKKPRGAAGSGQVSELTIP